MDLNQSPIRLKRNGKNGEMVTMAAPNMNNPPRDILTRVRRSERTWTVSTLPEIRFPASSSSRSVTVASPIADGSKLCQIIRVDDISAGSLEYNSLPTSGPRLIGSALSL